MADLMDNEQLNNKVQESNGEGSAESSSLLARIKTVFACKEQDIRAYSPLTLAYIGDVVYELVIRSIVVERANRSANDLHKTTVKYVKAGTQANLIQIMLDQELLDEEEISIYKRGRNAKSYTMAKNASMSEYRKATGFEALMGYLYLTDRMERCLALIKQSCELAKLEL